jgi:phosphoglycerol transferase MdoB-like AlkP superfamily enzyme
MRFRVFVLLKRLALLLAAFMITRLVFALLNLGSFAEVTFGNFLLALLHGIRFDLAAIAALNGLFIVLSLFPLRQAAGRTWQWLLLVLFLVVNLSALWMNLADAAYFKFTGKRSSSAVLGIWQDVSEQAGQLILNYWYLVLFGLLGGWLLARFYPKVKAHKSPRLWRISSWLPLLFCIPLAILAIRGGLQYKPVRVSHAFVLQPNILGYFTLNTPFVVMKSMSEPLLDRKEFFQTPQQVTKAQQLYPDPAPLSLKPGKQNVVILIMEGFASEYMGAGNTYPGYTPFLDSLARAGLHFTNHFANGRKSIDAVPALLAGIPAWMEEPYITSPFQGNTLKGLGTLLKPHGYSSAFFHGARNGSMGFDFFTKMAGFEQYYGLNEYPERQKDFDGNWGIFDEPYLQYSARKLTETKQPFVAAIFTLSSHQPYTIPKQHHGHFQKGTQEIHETIGYADYALKQFFKTASKLPWYANTLFIITGDHTQATDQPAYANLLGSYRTPLILFHPGNKLPNVATDKVAQHADVPATVLHYLGLPPSLPHFGHSVLDTSVAGRAFFYSGNAHYLLENGLLGFVSADDEVKVYDPKVDPLLASPLPDAPAVTPMKEQVKGWVQYFNNGLLVNSWFRDDSEK